MNLVDLNYFLLKKMMEEDYLLNQLSKLQVDAVLAEVAAVIKKECLVALFFN